jgi:hypothetical protein
MQATSEEDRQNWMNAIQGVILALINKSSAFAHVYHNYIQPLRMCIIIVCIYVCVCVCVCVCVYAHTFRKDCCIFPLCPDRVSS